MAFFANDADDTDDNADDFEFERCNTASEQFIKKYYAAFLIFIIPLTIILIAHTFFFIPEIIFIGLIFSSFSMFGIIIYDQIDRYIRWRREIAH